MACEAEIWPSQKKWALLPMSKLRPGQACSRSSGMWRWSWILETVRLAGQMQRQRERGEELLRKDYHHHCFRTKRPAHRRGPYGEAS